MAVVNPQRVLILSTSAGAGHVKAGEALEQAFAADPRVEKVLHQDALKYTNKLFRDFYSTLYFKLVKNAPALVGYFYHASDEPWKNETARHQFDRLNTGKLVKFIRGFAPDLIVCTHFMPAGLIAHLIEADQLHAQLSIVVTDFDCHAMWLSRIFHRYFVALPETKVHLEALGFPAERITVSGIPIAPDFTTPLDRAAVRLRYGLAPERPTLLLSAGAIGGLSADLVAGRLRECLRHDAQTIVVCGRNDDLRARVQAAVGENNPRFCVLGYSDRMGELMKISDLFIGKPGGLTTSELLACGVPMAIVQPIPGQEERNSDHLLEEGIAIKCNELTTLAFKIDQLLGDPPRLAAMRQKALAFARPAAAHTVVETLLADDLPVLVLDQAQREAMAQITGAHS